MADVARNRDRPGCQAPGDAIALTPKRATLTRCRFSTGHIETHCVGCGQAGRSPRGLLNSEQKHYGMPNITGLGRAKGRLSIGAGANRNR
jgi:hypothetical protein